jgi:outer membrane autotransporter protein
MPPPGRTVYVTQDTLSGRNAPGAKSVKLDITKVGDTSAQLTAIDYGTRNNENALLAGGEATETSKSKGTLYLSMTALADSLTQLSAYSGLAPTSVKFDLRSDRRFFVADSVNLFGSFNQGMSFQRLTHNLPGNFIRPTSLAFIDSNGVDALFVGGLNNADNAGNPLVVADSNANGNLFDWRRFGSGLPNTTIYALSYNERSDTLAVGTVGRGAYLLYDVTSNFASAKVLQFGLADNDSNPDLAILFGDRPLIKYGIGTLTINGYSTYTGGTLIEDGTLVAGTLDAAQKISFALGTGSVFLDRGTLRTPSSDRLVINVGGNYTQAPGGTLALGVAGIDGEDYDHVQVGRNASLNGTLALSSVSNFRPSNGDAFEFLLTKGIRSGEFARVSDSLNNRPNLTRIDLYAANGVALLYLSAPTPRQPLVLVTPDLLPVVEPNAPLTLPISLLDPGTEQLTSLYEISFSGANMQRFNLEARLAEVRRGSTGFASNLNVYVPTASYQETNNTSAAASGKSVVEKQSALQPAPENRWGVWVSGWGDFVNVGDDNFAKGYDFTTGGVTVGMDYRFTDHLAMGFFGSYAHTWTDLQPGSIDVDTGRGGLYGTYFDRGFYVNGMVFGGYNAYDMSRQALGFANGDSNGAEFSSFIGAGYDFHFGNFEIGPLTSLHYTYVSLNGFTEHDSLLPLQVRSDSQDSLRTDLGLRASYTWRLGRVLLVPTVTAAWEHEYNYSALPITVSAPVFGGETETSFGPREGHDSAIITAGVGIQWTPRVGTYVSYQGQLARTRYDSNAITGGISFSF